jgi:hypothetical protein
MVIGPGGVSTTTYIDLDLGSAADRGSGVRLGVNSQVAAVWVGGNPVSA